MAGKDTYDLSELNSGCQGTSSSTLSWSCFIICYCWQSGHEPLLVLLSSIAVLTCCCSCFHASIHCYSSHGLLLIILNLLLTSVILAMQCPHLISIMWCVSLPFWCLYRGWYFDSVLVCKYIVSRWAPTVYLYLYIVNWNLWCAEIRRSGGDHISLILHSCVCVTLKGN